MKNNKGFTLVEVVVSFSLLMVVMFFLLNTITKMVKRENNLLILQEYTVFEETLLNSIYNDIDNNISSENKITFKEEDNKILITGLNNYIEFDKNNNYIIYDDEIYELPNGISFDSDIYELESGIVNENNEYYVIKINLKLEDSSKNIKIVYQNNIVNNNA